MATPRLDKFIAKHSEALGYIIALLIAVWYISGILLIDAINPVAFIVIWIPSGLLATWFAFKW